MATGREKLVLLAIIVVALLAVMFVDWVHVTDEERVEATIRAMGAAVREENIDGLFLHVSDACVFSGATRDTMRALAMRFFDAFDGSSTKISRLRLNVSAPTAMAEVTMRDTSGQLHGGGVSVWELALTREADGVWRVTAVEMVELRGKPVKQWRDLKDMLQS